jgi:chromosome segregation ATPase
MSTAPVPESPAPEAPTTESKRIAMLFQKALASNSVREKNAFLNELKKLMKKHAADYSAAILEGERLDSAIVEVKANFNRVNEQYQDLKNSVSFLTELEFYQAAPDVASLRAMIESLERDISAIGPLPDRDMLATITASATSQQSLYLDLLDFRETRLKQLVDALKQRIRTAEQRLECASVVIDQFGSITNLLDKVRQLQDENEKLKVRKLRFSSESLLRPRRLTKCEPATLRAFLVALQNELAVVRAAVSDAQQASEDSIAKLPDESELTERLIANPVLKFSEPLPPLTHKPLEFDSAALTALADPEAAGAASDSIEMQLIQVDNQYAALKEKTQRLRSELTLRKNAERLATETGKQRIEKLHSLNERLLTEIHTLQEQSDSAESSKQILTEMLEQVTAERDRMRQKSQDLAAAYDQLFRDHLRLREEFKRTWKAGAGLFRLTELFGRAYLAQILEPSQYTAQVASFTPKDGPGRPGVPDFTENLPTVLMKFIEDIHFELIRRKAVAIVEKGTGTKVRELSEICQNLPFDD